MTNEEFSQKVQERAQARVQQTIGALLIQREELSCAVETLREEIADLKAKLAEKEALAVEPRSDG